jgi:hypothetical protein
MGIETEGTIIYGNPQNVDLTHLFTRKENHGTPA